MVAELFSPPILLYPRHQSQLSCLAPVRCGASSPSCGNWKGAGPALLHPHLLCQLSFTRAFGTGSPSLPSALSDGARATAYGSWRGEGPTLPHLSRWRQLSPHPHQISSAVPVRGGASSPALMTSGSALLHPHHQGQLLPR